MRATGIAAAPAPAACLGDFSDQQRVAQAFVAAAIRLGRVSWPSEIRVPTPDATDAALQYLPEPDPAPSPSYRGRHRRSITASLTASCQAARP